jgi:hypothetical protein
MLSRRDADYQTQAVLTMHPACSEHENACSLCQWDSVSTVVKWVHVRDMAVASLGALHARMPPFPTLTVHSIVLAKLQSALLLLENTRLGCLAKLVRSGR